MRGDDSEHPDSELRRRHRARLGKGKRVKGIHREKAPQRAQLKLGHRGGVEVRESLEQFSTGHRGEGAPPHIRRHLSHG